MTDQSKHPHRALIHAAAAISGFYVMSIELLGGRVFAPFFGTSIFVWGAIISVFMTALALGYLNGGSLSMKRPNLKTLGYVLLAEGLVSLPIVLADEIVLDWLSIWISDARYGSLIGALLFFSIPAWLSGMVSPYAIRLLTHSVNGAGQSAGRLYFASTLGSALGTIITSFYLVMFFDLDTIIMMMVSLVMLTGTVLIWAGSRTTEQEAIACAAS